MPPKNSTAFFACYLLTPVNAPQRFQCTYVGFTVAPTRRIRQHNGELVHGAKRTIKYRPWEMLLVVHGFPSKFHALQFEYAWQHPYSCRFTKAHLQKLVGTKGNGRPRSVKRKLIEVHEMLHVEPWKHFPLALTYTSHVVYDMARDAAKDAFQVPVHMQCEIQPLTCFATVTTTLSALDHEDHEDQRNTMCFICEQALESHSEQSIVSCYHPDCAMTCHLLCLADHFMATASSTDNNSGFRPREGTCPECVGVLLWPLVIKNNTRKRKRPSTPSATQAVEQNDSDEDDEAEQSTTWFDDDDHAFYEALSEEEVQDSRSQVIDLTQDD